MILLAQTDHTLLKRSTMLYRIFSLSGLIRSCLTELALIDSAHFYFD
jgi:hypothetical protein